jgi:hypothetical protein
MEKKSSEESFDNPVFDNPELFDIPNIYVNKNNITIKKIYLVLALVYTVVEPALKATDEQKGSQRFSFNRLWYLLQKQTKS